MILGQMVRFLFGPQSYAMTQALVRVLAAELDSGFSCTPGLVSDASDGLTMPISVPIWLGLGQQDLLLSPLPQKSKIPWLKSQDELWTCPDGRHYFHYEYPQQVAQQITRFWQWQTTAKIPHAQHLSPQKVA
jgi:pimeloyl-ACP methyl ester carboxylesterase